MFDHVGFNVSDLARSKAFYVAALAPLGIDVVEEGEGWLLFGRYGRPQFWIGAHGAATSGIHLAFGSEDREQVRRFHAAALTAGGMDNGAPGVREQYHSNYYGAFVIGPDGNNVEAVCHAPGV